MSSVTRAQAISLLERYMEVTIERRATLRALWVRASFYDPAIVPQHLIDQQRQEIVELQAQLDADEAKIRRLLETLWNAKGRDTALSALINRIGRRHRPS